MSDLSIIQAKLTLVIGVFSFSNRQRFAFSCDILINEARCRASLILFLHLLCLLYDFFDSDLLLADSEHISFLDHVLLGGQAFDYNPRLLLGLGVLADNVVMVEFFCLLLLI